MHSAFCCILLFLLSFRSCSPRLLHDAGGGDGFGRGERNNISHPGVAKLFSLFSLVQFKNDPCPSQQTVNGVNRNGTCYIRSQCEEKGGTVSGNCAAGFGVCCLFILSTAGGGTASQNCTYLQNAGYPSPLADTATAVSYTIQRSAEDVCLLCLDFERFTLAGTGGSANVDEGECLDMFTVTSPNAKFMPTICGENSGQHIYVDIGDAAGDTATLNFNFNAATNTQRFWDIKATQLECGNPNGPRDPGCLQYHTGCTGRITTFNYANDNDNHLNNQQYAVCIRQEKGFCCVEYMVCPDQRTLLNGGQPAGFSFDTTIANTKSKVDNQCKSAKNQEDFILIPQSGTSCSMSGGDSCRAINNRYCGGFLNGGKGIGVNLPVCDCTAPFTVEIFFNDISDAGTARGIANTRHSRGLCLDYRQIPC